MDILYTQATWKIHVLFVVNTQGYFPPYNDQKVLSMSFCLFWIK